MIVPLPRRPRTSEENILPLINIVFLLLIFFMLAGALSASAPFELDPPAARRASEVAAPTGGISIAADGRVALDGEVVPLDGLTGMVRRWRAERASGAPLTLRADARAESARLLAVIGALRAAGVERVRVLAVGRARDR